MTQWIKYVGFNHLAPTWTLALCVLFWLTLPLMYYTYSNLSYIQSVYRRRKRLDIGPEMNEVTIVVLGDLGHSPRMTYHARSFAKLGYHVNLCGYLESEIPSFLKSPDVSIYDIPVIKNARRLPYLLFALIKVVSQIYQLTLLLQSIIDDSTRFVIIQNPPSLPVLFIIGMLKKYWAPNTQIIIDWHNLNWSILNLKYQNENYPVVKIMRKYEHYCGKTFADFNLTVTEALKDYLVTEFEIDREKITTLYDRPSDIFQPLSSQDELKQIVSASSPIFKNLGYNQMTDRILVTSTSFTPDEDFAVLVESLINLDKMIESSNDKHRILTFVTGKGPLQSEFLESLETHEWKNIAIKNVWLPIEEYPNILKIADLGISLHYSSSGLDLPMKIVDLFGSGVPVISMNYPVIKELVKPEVNGLLLANNKDSQEMAETIYDVLFKNNSRYLKIKEGALLESQRHWDDEWNSKLSKALSLRNTNRL